MAILLKAILVDLPSYQLELGLTVFKTSLFFNTLFQYPPSTTIHSQFGPKLVKKPWDVCRLRFFFFFFFFFFCSFSLPEYERAEKHDSVL